MRVPQKNGAQGIIPVDEFRVVDWNETILEKENGVERTRERHFIVIYARAEGVIYEFSGRTWMPLPIEPSRIAEPPRVEAR